MASTEHHAKPPRIPPATRALERSQAERDAYIRERRALEQRSILRGLMLVALVILLVSIARAGLGRVYPAGWWRP